MRTSIDIHQSRVFLAVVVVEGFYQSVAEVGLAVGGFDGAHLYLRHGVVGQGVGGRVDAADLFAFVGNQHHIGRHVGAAVAVDKQCAVGIGDDAVGAVVGSETCYLARFDVHRIGGAFRRFFDVGIEENIVALGVGADDVLHLVVALSDLFHKAAVGVVEVDMFVSVAVAQPEELVGLGGQEIESVDGFGVTLVLLFEEHFFQFARLHVVAFEPHVVLLAVNLGDVESLFVGTPREVGEVHLAFGHGGVAAGVEIQRGAFQSVEDAHGNLVTLHPGHGVFYRCGGGDTCGGVHHRVVGNHALVHTVEGQQVALRRPESAFLDTELRAVHRLSVHDAVAALAHGEHLLTAVHIQAAADGVCHLIVFRVKVHILGGGVVSNWFSKTFGFDIIQIGTVAIDKTEFLVVYELDIGKIT